MTDSTDKNVSGVELPIKKTTGDTLKERMDSNAYERILPARYQMKNENGELVEEQEDVFERVAKNLALAEALYESERQNETVKVTPTQIKDNHNKRDELVENVFGERLTPEEAENEGFEEELTEENVKYFSYDNVVPELSPDVKEHVEHVQEKFQDHMENLKWTPNTPTIINAGDSLQMLAACFVNSPDDSMESIHQTAKEASMIFRGGGGVGYGIWKLRPKGDDVGSTGGKTSGPISFLRTYDTVCSTVEAGGVRRGAQMAVMRVSHPDVLEFIHSKDKDVSLAHELSLNDPDDFTHTKFKEALQEARELLDDYGGVPEHLRNAVEGHLSNFNISVGITDDFMECVKNNETYTFTNPKTNEPFIANEETVETYEMFGLGEHIEEGEVLEVPANIIWEHVIQGAHENGEPGVVYLERMNKQSSFDVEKHPEKRIEATNPCLSGDMKVAVADGRGEVEIQKLAKEKDKIPVFTHNKEKNKIEVKDATAFKTKENAETIKIETDGNLELELTPDHEVYTNNRGKVEAQNLEPQDSLVVMTQWNTDAVGGSKQEYRMLHSQGYQKSEHRLIADHHTDKDISDLVVHHKDCDGLNNKPENLEPLTREEHKEKHDISGENNPLQKLKERGEFEEYMERSDFYDVEGENNPMYGVERDDLKERVEFNCPECENTIEVTPYNKQVRKYCSIECRGKARRERKSYECVVCETEIETTPAVAEERRYCSRQCAAQEYEERLSEEGREALQDNVWGEDNPMRDDEVAKKSAENTDYEKQGEKVSKSRKEMIENGELKIETIEKEENIECKECNNEYKSITNTHLNNEHNMTVEEYQDKYPHAELGMEKVRMTKENHKVTNVRKTEETKDVYDMTVPDTHNFYSGKNTLENKTNDQKYYVKKSNCAEEPLFQADSCNLNHINLSTILDENCVVQDYGEFSDSYEDGDVEEVVDEYLEQVVDWNDLDERIHYNTRFLDNVVTMCDYPIPKIEETTRKTRKIGLGIMGYAQMLIQMGVSYGSEEGNEIARQLMNYINDETAVASQQLAVSDNPGMNRGVFEEWDKSKWSNPEEYTEWFEHGFTRDDAEEWMDGFPVRNHTLTTLAPTGTTSRLGNTTGGCEPMYSVANFSNVSDDIQGESMLVDFDDMFLRVLEANDIDIEDVKQEATEQMNNNTFDGVEGLESVPERLNDLFVTTQDLGPIEHASVQCAFQEGVGSAISKTVNAPNDSTMEDAKKAFEYVYDNGGKGVTYYRDGSRSKQVLTTRKDNKEMADDESPEEFVANMVNNGELEVDELVDTLQSEADMRLVADEGTLSISEYRRRPDMLPGMNIRVTTGYGTLYVWISEDVNGDMFEVFAQVGKSGGSTQSLTEALGRMISMSLRYGVPPQRIVKHLRGIKSSRVGYENGETIESIADGIAYAMNLYNENDGVVGILSEVRENSDGELAEMIVGDNPPENMDLEEKRQMVDDAVTGKSVSVSENGSFTGTDETDAEPDKEQLDAAELIQRGEDPECPKCGDENLYYSEGCKSCRSCGWSKC